MTPEFDKLVDELLLEAGKCSHPSSRELSTKKGFKWMACMENPYSQGIRRVFWGRRDGSFNHKRCNKPQRRGTEGGEECRDYHIARRKRALIQMLKSRLSRQS